MFTNGTNVASVGWYSTGETYLTDRCVTLQNKSKCQKQVTELHTSIQKNLWRSSNGRKHIIPTDLLCTSSGKGENDRCDILPGSALVKYNAEARKWYLGGLLTWGSNNLKDCKKHMTGFDIYTKTDRHIKWIRTVTKINLRYPDETDSRAFRRRQHG